MNSIARTKARIIFVSGKGGVGKSLISAAIAREEAAKGRKVLLAEIGETSYFKDFWHLPGVTHQPVRVRGGFDLALWSGESSLREYVLHYLKLERLFKLFFDNKVMRSLIDVAPGLKEVAILGKITSGIRKVGPPLVYDLIVVDCFATGHAMALLNAPKGMMEAIKFGPMGHHSREMENVLRDPKLTAYVVVTLLEELPVIETLEFCESVKREFGIEPEVIANKVLTMPTAPASLEKLANESTLGEFAKHLSMINTRQDMYLEQLRKNVSTIEIVPLSFSNDPDKVVEQAGEALRNS